MFVGGYISPASVDTTDYVEISSLGNFSDFGNLTSGKSDGAAISSTTKGVYAGGKTNPANAYTDGMDVFTIATIGNATDFGDLITTASRFAGNTSSSTRGIFSGGYAPAAPDV